METENNYLVPVPGLGYTFRMTDKEEVDRLITILRTSIRLLGLSNREIERRLGLTPSYVSRIFAGNIELKAEHIFAIARAMGLQPWEIFELAYPRRSDAPTESFQTIRNLLRSMQPPEPPAPLPVAPPISEQEIDQKVEQSVRRILREMRSAK